MRIYQKRFLTLLIVLLLLALGFMVWFLVQYQKPKEFIGYSGLLPQAHAQAAVEEYIDDFQAEVSIQDDSSVIITESISYNFGDQQKHGIYRNIPYKYFARGGNFTLGWKILAVGSDMGVAIPYEVSKQSGYINLKIGDPESYVSGLQTYVIRYSLNRVINFFGDHDEFYWNVTGNDWEAPIDRAGIIVRLPEGVSAADMQAECFTGLSGSSEQNCQVSNVTNSQVGYSVFQSLAPGEGLTIVLGWPKGVLTKPSLLTQAGWILRDNPLILLPLVSLLVMMMLWYTRGRDKGSKRSIIPFYEAPAKLTPAEIGSLIDETVNLRDISATFIDLASRGYLKIKSLGKHDWQLIKLREFDDLTVWEKEFAEAVFSDGSEVKLSELKSKFYTHLPKLKNNLYRSLVEKGYFPKSPSKVRLIYLLIAFLLMILGVIVLPFFGGGWNILMVVISAIIVGWLGHYMPYKTKLGTEVYQQIKGYRLYLKVAEKDRLNFHNAPSKTPEEFEKNLAGAMALGVEKKWARQFDGIYVNQPSWYEGNFKTFNAVILVNSLNSFNHTAVVNLSSAGQGAAGGHSGFGGGGFSGGGFGGGGGGSW